MTSERQYTSKEEGLAMQTASGKPRSLTSLREGDIVECTGDPESSMDSPEFKYAPCPGNRRTIEQILFLSPAYGNQVTFAKLPSQDGQYHIALSLMPAYFKLA